MTETRTSEDLRAVIERCDEVTKGHFRLSVLDMIRAARERYDAQEITRREYVQTLDALRQALDIAGWSDADEEDRRSLEEFIARGLRETQYDDN